MVMFCRDENNIVLLKPNYYYISCLLLYFVSLVIFVDTFWVRQENSGEIISNSISSDLQFIAVKPFPNV